MSEFTLPLSDRAERLLSAHPLKYIMALIPHIGPEMRFKTFLYLLPTVYIQWEVN